MSDSSSSGPLNSAAGSSADDIPSRDEICSDYLDLLEHDPYPVQEEALLAWFTHPQGVLVCAPTGMGKTLIAEAALYEALRTRKVAYYTTPLIALTEQKFQEMQEAAVRWGFSKDDVGLVTGNRSVNPHALVRVVVAEILVNRLLHAEEFDFDNVSAVVMDEFHSFNDPERGIVWELSLVLLPAHVRLLLLSATVGNTAEFLIWLNRSHNRKVQLIQSFERRVPLRYHWVGDALLNEQLEEMAGGDEESRRTPALVFCFNRDQCWNVAEQMRGKNLITAEHQKQLKAELEQHDFSKGAGPKLKPILLRGVGLHHAGLMPGYRRIVESLFQRKLLSICVCTETLAAGINLPARSVLLTSLMKGPPGRKRLVDASAAHQMFGRAGRPQFDDQGHVFALAHEDDVKIARAKAEYDKIPEDTKDPQLLRHKKRLKKKIPTRRKNEQYWGEEHFEKLKSAPPGRLSSRGPLTWRLLAYLLTISPEVSLLDDFCGRRLMDSGQIEAARRHLKDMLVALWAGGYVRLFPEPPFARPADEAAAAAEAETAEPAEDTAEEKTSEAAEPADGKAAAAPGLFGSLLQEAREESGAVRPAGKAKKKSGGQSGSGSGRELTPEQEWVPLQAQPTDQLSRLLEFRSVNPLFGDFLVKQLDIADSEERLQALESVLELPGSVARHVRVPPPDRLPPGWLAANRLDMELIQRGIATQEDLYPPWEPELPPEERRYAPPVAEKLAMLFRANFPAAGNLRLTPVRAAAELLSLGGNFQTFISSKGLARQEGIVFRHLLRLILLCGEFARVTPPDGTGSDWREEMEGIAERLTETCRAVDQNSTDKAIESAAKQADVVLEEPPPEADVTSA